MNRFSLLGLLLLEPWAAQAQARNPLKQLLRQDTTAAIRRVLAAPKAHRVQILYTQINRDAAGRAHFRSYAYRLRPNEYFYPASTVKLPAVAVALEQIALHNAGAGTNGAPPAHLGREQPLRIDSAFAGQTRVRTDSTAPARRPTLGHYMRKVLLVSDNDAFNRLYEFVGQRHMAAALARRGLRRTRIIHRLSVGDQEPGSRHTNPFAFFSDTLATAPHYQQPAAYNPDPLPALRAQHIRIGRAYMEGDKRVEQPLDFGSKNSFPLDEQQQVLRALLFPDFVPAPERFALAPVDYGFLRKYLSLTPRKSRYPTYNPIEYSDNYVKFLLAGGPPAPLPEGVRIYNKIGQAYGFLIDNACVVDSVRGVEFLLSAVVYTNADGVLNDDRYDYDAMGFPFLRRLGQLVYDFELTRTSPARTTHIRTYWSADKEQAQP